MKRTAFDPGPSPTSTADADGDRWTLVFVRDCDTRRRRCGRR